MSVLSGGSTAVTSRYATASLDPPAARYAIPHTALHWQRSTRTGCGGRGGGRSCRWREGSRAGHWKGWEGKGASWSRNVLARHIPVTATSPASLPHVFHQLSPFPVLEFGGPIHMFLWLPPCVRHKGANLLPAGRDSPCLAASFRCRGDVVWHSTPTTHALFISATSCRCSTDL